MSSLIALSPSPKSETVNADRDASEISNILSTIVASNPEISAPVAAIKTLLEIIKHSKATTMSEFIETLRASSQSMKESCDHPISISAGCDLFMRFVTLTSHDLTEFETCKEYLLQSGNLVVEKALKQKRMIVQNGQDFIRDGSVLLLHSYSRVVMMLIEAAAQRNKRFTVYITESLPSNSGYRVADQLKQLGIPVTVILDSAVGYIIGKIDMVLVGAEGVVENGGIINSIGTYQIAMIAKAAKKPFYAAAESFKFVRLFPLNQYDLPFHKSSTVPHSHLPSPIGDKAIHSYVEQHNATISQNPSVDYTPPQYITLLFTDIGVLTPSGVSDELIKLYY